MSTSDRHAARTQPSRLLDADLPLHHRDPFDRIIVAQAMTEPIHLYTVDPKLSAYTDLVRQA